MRQNAMKRSLALLLAVALVLTIGASSAFAKTKSVKKCNFSTQISKVSKKATKVKRGTTTLKYKGASGFVKFKAPKTKRYTFTFSNMKFNAYYGYFYIMKPGSYGYLNIKKCKTNGGKTSSFYIASKGNGQTSGKKVNRNLEKRYAKIKLKKGQTVYIYFWHVTYEDRAKGAKAKLKIK